MHPGARHAPLRDLRGRRDARRPRLPAPVRPDGGVTDEPQGVLGVDLDLDARRRADGTPRLQLVRLAAPADREGIGALRGVPSPSGRRHHPGVRRRGPRRPEGPADLPARPLLGRGPGPDRPGRVVRPRPPGPPRGRGLPGHVGGVRPGVRRAALAALRPRRGGRHPSSPARLRELRQRAHRLGSGGRAPGRHAPPHLAAPPTPGRTDGPAFVDGSLHRSVPALAGVGVAVDPGGRGGVRELGCTR